MSNYITIDIVGNKYQKKKPSKNDKKILFIDEPDNIHDKNAIAIYSDRNTYYKKLGYVPKYDTWRIQKIKNNFKNIKGIINNNLYYSIVIELSDIK